MHISSPFSGYEWIARGVEDDEAGLIRLRRLGEKLEILTAADRIIVQWCVYSQQQSTNVSEVKPFDSYSSYSHEVRFKKPRENQLTCWAIGGRAALRMADASMHQCSDVDECLQF
jgi:hypothetical protein